MAFKAATDKCCLVCVRVYQRSVFAVCGSVSVLGPIPPRFLGFVGPGVPILGSRENASPSAGSI